MIAGRLWRRCKGEQLACALWNSGGELVAYPTLQAAACRGHLQPCDRPDRPQSLHSALLVLAAAAGASIALPQQARCDTEPEAGANWNEHTAKFTIFKNNARRCTIEGSFSEAERWWDKAEAEAGQAWGDKDEHHAVVANGRAELYRAWGGDRLALAETYYRESVAIMLREVGKDDVRYAAAVQHLGQYYTDCGRYTEATKMLTLSTEVRKKVLGAQHVDYLESLSLLGDAQRAAGQVGKAVSTLQQCVCALREIGRDEGTVATKIKLRLLTALLDSGALDAAFDVVHSMLAYAENVHITEHAATFRALERVTDAMTRDRRPTAKQLEKLRSAADFFAEVRAEAYGTESANHAMALRLQAKVNLISDSAHERSAGLQAALDSAEVLRRTWDEMREPIVAADSQPWVLATFRWLLSKVNTSASPTPGTDDFSRLRCNVCAVEMGETVALSFRRPAVEAATEPQKQQRTLLLHEAIEALENPVPLTSVQDDGTASSSAASWSQTATVRVPRAQYLRVELLRLDTVLDLLQGYAQVGGDVALLKQAPERTTHYSSLYQATKARRDEVWNEMQRGAAPATKSA